LLSKRKRGERKIRASKGYTNKTKKPKKKKKSNYCPTRKGSAVSGKRNTSSTTLLKGM